MRDTGSDTVRLSSGASEATVALRGAEPLSWRVDGREFLWHGDPEHWSYSAPILFPVVGASTGGMVRVEGRDYPMAQHGFARTMPFGLVERGPDRVRLRLADNAHTRAHYPFGFGLDVVANLASHSLTLRFAVTNAAPAAMPYGLGFHPAFPWPLEPGHGPEGHRVVFDAEEEPTVPEIAAGGLLARRSRPVPLHGRVLPLSPDLFSEALVFLDARSRGFAFEASSGAAVAMELDGFPHLAIWSRPSAPFLSLEAWTAHADWEDADGDLLGRPSMTILRPGEVGHHRVTMRWRPA